MIALIAITLITTGTSAHAVSTPGAITSVTAGPGASPGEVTISWKQDGSNMTSFRLETALSPFSKTDSSLPKTGRRGKVFSIDRAKRSITLSATQVASAGAPVESGEFLYFRLFAVNQTSSGTAIRAYPYLKTVLPRPVAPKPDGTELRAATFNVRTARATWDARSWLERARDVAAEILSRNPGLVAVQELGPGRADGQTGSLNGTLRQTESLELELANAGASRYQLVRTTPYVKPGTTHGTQGARILYDTTRYQLRSYCPEKSSDGTYSPACSIQLPIRSEDSESHRRKAAYAEFQDRSTGERFFYVSAHLDHRHSSTASVEASYDALRGAQAVAIVDRMASLNTHKLPIIFGGDTNSWQKSQIGNSANEVLVSRGYYDTAATLTRIRLAYATVNHFDLEVKPNGLGVGARLDVIKMWGSQGAKRTENVLQVVDSERPSDHNLVVSDLVL